MRPTCTNCAKPVSSNGVTFLTAAQHSRKFGGGQNKIGPFRGGSERAAAAGRLCMPLRFLRRLRRGGRLDFEPRLKPVNLSLDAASAHLGRHVAQAAQGRIQQRVDRDFLLKTINRVARTVTRLR